MQWAYWLGCPWHRLEVRNEGRDVSYDQVGGCPDSSINYRRCEMVGLRSVNGDVVGM